MKHTTFYNIHKNLGAKIVEFAGYEMPIQYSSIIAEHKAVRNSVGVFDVSHLSLIHIYAKQANGSVMVRYGDTMVLVTAVAASEAKEGLDYFPLQVEYREKTSAAGKFPGGYIKREGRPTEKEILSSRLCDRPIMSLIHI